MRVNINFERRDLTSEQKSNPSPDNFGETFAFPNPQAPPVAYVLNWWLLFQPKNI